jgi:hypothetical protein
MQESMRLFKLIIETDYIDSIIINNRGVISVRIRALYVAQVLICDPSTLEGDSYIAPKEGLTITLCDFSRDFGKALSGQWTGTTKEVQKPQGSRRNSIGTANCTQLSASDARTCFTYKVGAYI